MAVAVSALSDIPKQPCQNTLI
ncbi:hypothetical protein PO124_25530 [Bacillus licheniformis]|nr:hypothetical protein [Bacillus licheniformis]